MTHLLSKITRFCLLLALLLGSTLVSTLAQVPDSVYHERVTLLVRLWGHVKYFHPKVADGSHNWDQTLISHQPALKRAETDADFNAVLMDMLNEVGEVPESDLDRPTAPDSLNNNLDLSWMQDPLFSEEVKDYLERVWEQATYRSHVKVIRQWEGGPPSFDADVAYSGGEEYPDEPLRLLAIARFWNIIHYFFPYKDLMDLDWESSLERSIPEVLGAYNGQEYHLSMLRLVNRIDDTHSFFNSTPYWNWRGVSYPPFLARFIEDKLIVTKTILNLGSVSVGDFILSIDGKKVEEWVEELWPYANGSNEVTKLSIIGEMIFRGDPGSFEATLFDGTREYTVELERSGTYTDYLLGTENEPYWIETVNGCRIGRVDMGLLERSQIPKMFNEFNRMDVLIFDIRNYPNGTLWELVNYLFSEPIHIATFETPNITFPGHFFMVEEEIGQGSSSPWEGGLMILFDERTLSQAEYTIMGLEQFPGAIKVGSQTAAADGNVAQITLPGSMQATATFLGVFYPDFTPTQRVGIEPDIFVRPTIEGTRAGRDEVLEAAYEAIDIGQCLSTGLPNQVDPYEIALYPNPVVDQVTYQLPEEFEGEKVEITVVDAQGKVVYERTTRELRGGFSLVSAPRGMYVIRFHGEEHQAERPLFKR